MDDDYYHYRRHDHHVTETNPDYTGRFQHINSAQYRDRYRSFDRDRLRERYDHLLPGERFIHDGRVYRYGQSQHEAYSEDHDRYSPVERVQPRRSYHHNDMSERERRMPVTERSRWGHGYELDSRSDGRFVKDHSNLMFDYAHNSKTFDGNYQISNNDQFFTYDPSVTDWSEFRTTSNWQDVQTSHQRKGVAAQDKNNVQSGKPLASARSLVRVKGSASRLMAASSDQNLAAKRISKPGKKNTATPSKAVLQSKCTVAGEVTSSSAQEPTSANSESLPIIERSARQTGIKEQISPQTKVKNKTIQKQRSPIKGNLTKTIANRQQIVAQTKDLAVAHGIQFTPKTVNRGAQSSLNLSSRSTSETSRNVKIPDKPSNIVTSKILPENIHQEKIANKNKTLHRNQSLDSESFSTPNIVWSRGESMETQAILGTIEKRRTMLATTPTKTSQNPRSRRTSTIHKNNLEKTNVLPKPTLNASTSGCGVEQRAPGNSSAAPNPNSTVSSNINQISKATSQQTSPIASQDMEGNQIPVIVSRNYPASKQIGSSKVQGWNVTAIPSNKEKTGAQINPDNDSQRFPLKGNVLGSSPSPHMKNDSKQLDKLELDSKTNGGVLVTSKPTENFIVQRKTIDKIVDQTKDKVTEQSKNSDTVMTLSYPNSNITVQQKASDHVIVQSQPNKTVMNQSKASGKSIVQSKDSDSIIVQSKDSDSIIVQSKDCDSIIVQPKDSDSIIVPSKDSDSIIVQSKDSDSIIVQSKDSDSIIVQSKDSDSIIVPSKAREPTIVLSKTSDNDNVQSKTKHIVPTQQNSTGKFNDKQKLAEKVTTPQVEINYLTKQKIKETIDVPQSPNVKIRIEKVSSENTVGPLPSETDSNKILTQPNFNQKDIVQPESTDKTSQQSLDKVVVQTNLPNKELAQHTSHEKVLSKQNSNNGITGSGNLSVQALTPSHKLVIPAKISHKDDQSSIEKTVVSQIPSEKLLKQKSSDSILVKQTSSESVCNRKSQSRDKGLDKGKSYDRIVASSKSGKKGLNQPNAKAFVSQKSRGKVHASHSNEKLSNTLKLKDNIVASQKSTEGGFEQPDKNVKNFAHEKSIEKRFDQPKPVVKLYSNQKSIEKGFDQPKSGVKVFAHQKSSEKVLDKSKSSENLPEEAAFIDGNLFQSNLDPADSDSDDSVLDSVPVLLKTLQRASSITESMDKTLTIDRADHDILSDTEASDFLKPISTTRENKIKFSLDDLLSERKGRVVKDKKLEDMQEALKAVINKGGFFHVESDEEQNIGDDLLPEHQQQLNYFSVKEERIVEIHPGVMVFSPETYKNLYSETLSLRTCGFSPGRSYIDKCLSSLPPDGMSSFLTSHLLSMTFDKVSCPQAVLTWLFYIMSVHPNRLVLDGCRQDLAEIITHQQEFQNLAITWAPTLQTILRVLINNGAKLSSLCSDRGLLGLSDDEIRVLETPLEGDTKENQPPPQEIPQMDKRRLNRENFRQAIQIIEMSLRGRPGYTKEQLLALTVIMCNSALDKSLVNLMLHHEFQVCLASLIELFPDKEWHEQAVSICQCLYRLTPHHHNRVYVVELFPPTPRGHYIQRRLSYLILCDILQVQQYSQDLQQLKVQHLLAMIGKMRELIHTDLYQLSSIINLMDKCVGNERLPLTEKGDLIALIDSVRNLTGQIRDNISMLDRTKVKDMMVRLTSTWTLRMHSMSSKQPTLFTCKKSSSPGKMFVETVASQETDSESESTDEDEPVAKKMARRNVVSKSAESLCFVESMDTTTKEVEVSCHGPSSAVKVEITKEEEIDQSLLVNNDDDDLPEL